VTRFTNGVKFGIEEWTWSGPLVHEYDQYTVFTEQQHLDDLNYSKNSIRDKA